MTRILSRAFGVVALVGVTLALAACAAQTPERETGATTVPGTETDAVQISQPVTTVGGLGVAKAVIPASDVVTPTQLVTKVETASGEVLYVERESGKVLYVTPQLGET